MYHLWLSVSYISSRSRFVLLSLAATSRKPGSGYAFGIIKSKLLYNDSQVKKKSQIITVNRFSKNGRFSNKILGYLTKSGTTHSAVYRDKLVPGVLGPCLLHITNVGTDWEPAKCTKKSQWDCLVAAKITSYKLIPRSYQSLNMFKSCLVKHGLKLFSLKKLLTDVFVLQIQHKLKTCLSSSNSCIKARVAVFL